MFVTGSPGKTGPAGPTGPQGEKGKYCVKTYKKDHAFMLKGWTPGKLSGCEDESTFLVWPSRLEELFLL